VSIEDVAVALERSLGDSVQRNARVAELTTYRVGGPVAILVHAADETALGEIATVLGDHPLPVLVIGRGSNLLVAERGFDGVGIVLTGEFESVHLDRRAGSVRAGGAVPLPILARRTAAAGLAGLEFYVGIPGSVGGAVRTNAGGHGTSTHEILVRAWVRDLAGGGTTEVRDVEQLRYSYRCSDLGPTDVVTEAEFRARADAPEVCEARLAEVVRWRREHQPGGANAGSVFRNPPGDSAGRLIDAAGLKGLRVGGAVVSAKHANFFQAECGATADDVACLVETVRARVADATGVVLEPELTMVGFEPGTQPAPGRPVANREVGS
jgi:UDP-N-acetylmuramate dehydrogenase